jgi:hypothetical protein
LPQIRITAGLILKKLPFMPFLTPWFEGMNAGRRVGLFHDE